MGYQNVEIYTSTPYKARKSMIEKLTCSINYTDSKIALSLTEHIYCYFIGNIITMEQFRNIILTHEVPITTCLVAMMGLPSSGKTTALEKVLKMKIKLKEEAKWPFDGYMKRKRNKQCLSLYELCVLGGSPHNQYAWSFATNRYGAIFSILCSLIRSSTCIEGVSFEKAATMSHSSLLDEHFQWLMENAEQHLDGIRKDQRKLTFLQDGLSLINIMDVGVNKALYDFLPIMMLFCRNHVRLAFYSSNRDGPILDTPPDLSPTLYGNRKDDSVVMKRRSRLTYFLHFATVGYQQITQQQEQQKRYDDNTIVIAAKKGKNMTGDEDTAKEQILTQARVQGVDKFLKNWKQVDVDDEESLKEVGEFLQDLIKRTHQYQRKLPLRWIILRSLVISLKKKGVAPTILHRNGIVNVAKGLKMKEDEVDDFLTAFTDFGSILYMPKFEALKNLVIVDIWEFTQHLNKLFYPEAHTRHAYHLVKYGIITKTSTSEILGSEEKYFMQIVTTFAMAARIQNSRAVVFDDERPLCPDEECYYLPLARVGEAYRPTAEENDYAFLEIRSVNFPANVLACVSHGVMKNDDAILLATEHNNTSRFQFKPQNGPVVQIEIIYEGSTTRLRVINNNNDILASDATALVCRKVLEACCNCLERKTNLIRDLRYNVGIPCCGVSKDSHHFIYSDDRSDVCDACLVDKPQNLFRKCWIKAAEMVSS